MNNLLMKKGRNTPILIPTSLLFITAWCATNAFGGLSLTNIPTLGSDTSNEGRCITYDGKYVGGLSGTAQGFFYDVANNMVTNLNTTPATSGSTKAVSGICYRLDTNQTPAQLQIICDTEAAGWRAYFMTTNVGLTWNRTLMNSTYAYSTYGGLPGNNSLAGTTNGDVFISVFRNSGKTAVYALYNSNLWDSVTAPLWKEVNKSVNSPSTVDATGISATGRVVGRRTDGDAISRNNFWDWPPASGTSYQPVVLDGTTAGQIWSISQDGNTIFGWSHLTTDAVNNYGYKAVFSGTSVNAQPPGTGVTLVSLNPLPENPRTGGSTTRCQPIGASSDGNYVSGYRIHPRYGGSALGYQRSRPHQVEGH